MSIAEQIRDLEALASIDAQLKILDDQLTQERATLATLTASLKRLEEKLAGDKTTLAATERLRNEYITEVRSMQQQLEHSREKMSRSRNEREANAAQREGEELRKLVRDREEEVGKLTTECEAVRQRIEATEGEIKGVEGELGTTAGEIRTRVTVVEEARAAKDAERNAAIKRVPPQIFRKYDMIRKKRGTAIAAVTTEGTCRACNIALPPQLFHRLRRETLLEQCPSCNRLIYFLLPAEKVATGAD